MNQLWFSTRRLSLLVARLLQSAVVWDFMAYNNHPCPWVPPLIVRWLLTINPRLPCVIYNLVPRPVIWMGPRKNLVTSIACLAPVKNASLATLISMHGFKTRKPRSFRTQVSRIPRNVLQKVLLIVKVINSVAKDNNMFWSCCSASSSVFFLLLCVVLYNMFS